MKTFLLKKPRGSTSLNISSNSKLNLHKTPWRQQKIPQNSRRTKKFRTEVRPEKTCKNNRL